MFSPSVWYRLVVGGLVALLIGFVPAVAHAQLLDSGDSGEIAKATDYSIPSSPAFTLLGVNPSQVVTPTFPRDVRLDLVSTGDEVLPNLAVQAAPVWVLGYDDVSVSRYQERDYVRRTLSTLNVSAGTVQETLSGGDTQRRLAAAVTLRLAGYDPLRDDDYIAALEDALEVPSQQVEMSQIRMGFLSEYRDDRDMQRALDELLTSRVDKLVDTPCSKKIARGDLKVDSVEVPSGVSTADVNAVIDKMHRTRVQMCESTITYQKQRIQELRKEKQAEHWNDASLEIAGGNVWTYNQPELDPDLRFVGVGYGAWINGATGLGTDNALVSALARVLRSDGENSYFFGLNVRYGSDDLNLFVEYAHDFLPLEQHRNTFAYGGGFDLSETLNVQFGLRHEFDGGLDPTQLVPLVKLNGKTTNLLSALGV